MIKDIPNIVILKDDKKDFMTHYVAVSKFNENYFKYTSNEHNEFFVIPVVESPNLYMIYHRDELPQIFNSFTIEYNLQIIKMPELVTPRISNADTILCNQNIRTTISTPFELITFLYNLRELSLFNFMFNDKGRENTYIFSVEGYKISDGKNSHFKEICGVNNLITDLEAKHLMKTRTSEKYNLHLNEDGTCSYSNYYRYLNETANLKDEMLGNLDLKSNYIESISLPYFEEPIYSFIDKSLIDTISEIDRYDMFNNGSITLFMGTAFDSNILSAPDGNIFLSSANFDFRHTSTFKINKLPNILMYVKLAARMMRIIAKLISMPDEYQSLSEVYPGFNYTMEFYPFNMGKTYRYSRNFIWQSIETDQTISTDIQKTDISISCTNRNNPKANIFKRLCDDIKDFWVPF